MGRGEWEFRTCVAESAQSSARETCTRHGGDHPRRQAAVAFAQPSTACRAGARAGGRQAATPRARPPTRPRRITRTATLDTVTVTAQKRARTCRRCRSASRCSASEKLDELNVTDFEDYVKLPAERPSHAGACRPGLPRRSTCAAWPAAATATTPVRCPASACTSTSSRSPRSRARSTCTSTTSRASKRSPARRARCTAPARRRARCASSPTSPMPRGFAAGYGLEVNAIERRRHRPRARRLRQHADREQRRDPRRRLEPARCRLRRQRRRAIRATCSAQPSATIDCTDQPTSAPSPRTTTTTSTPPARASR